MAKQEPEPNLTSVRQTLRRLLNEGGIQTEPTYLGDAYRPVRSHLKKRKLSTFNVVLSLFGLAVAVVLYISNIIAVSHLSAEINNLERRIQTVTNTNELLRAELSRRSSLERIGKIATEELGLRFPQEQPVWLKIDEELIEQLERE